MQRIFMVAAVVVFMASSSAQSASAGWFRGNHLRARHIVRSTSSKCGDRVTPWYIDRVDPLLEEQAWYSS